MSSCLKESCSICQLAHDYSATVQWGDDAAMGQLFPPPPPGSCTVTSSVGFDIVHQVLVNIGKKIAISKQAEWGDHGGGFSSALS